MSRAVPLLTIGLALVGAVWPTGGSEPARATIPGDEYTILLLEESRPYLVRFHLQASGRSYRKGWDDSVAELFRYLDVNRDGALDEKELSRAPGESQFLRILQGAEDLEPEPAPSFKEVAGEGSPTRITYERLAAYYSRSLAKPISSEWIVKEGKSGKLSEVLFRLLDADKDGKLSAEELAAAPAVLGKFDSDLDELIAPAELVTPVPFERFVRLSQDRPHAGRYPPFFVVDRDTPALAAADRLIARYDSDSDGRLQPAEISFEPNMFSRLDTNKDNALDRQELSVWLNEAAELEIVVRLDGTGGPTVATLPPAGRSRPFLQARPTRYGSLLLTLPTGQLDILVKGGESLSSKRERGKLEGLFRSLDVNKNNVLDKREAYRPPFAMVPYLRLADTDGDGELTWREWTAFLDLRERVGAQAVLMTWLDRGRRLFDFLDANHDGKLSRRELLEARARLAPFARNGKIGADDVPKQAQVLFQLGRPDQSLPSNGREGPNMFTPAPRYAGPLWFRKMDRNRDGDVSPREFLGAPEFFKRIDTDGDGLIDPDEAERADREYRRRNAASP